MGMSQSPFETSPSINTFQTALFILLSISLTLCYHGLKHSIQPQVLLIGCWMPEQVPPPILLSPSKVLAAMLSQPRKLILGILLGTALLGSLLSGQASARRSLDIYGTPTIPLVRLAASPSVGAPMRLVFAETEPESNQSTLWLANIPDLSVRVALANLSHRVGYPPTGNVSPDGKWIAIFLSLQMPRKAPSAPMAASCG